MGVFVVFGRFFFFFSFRGTRGYVDCYSNCLLHFTYLLWFSASQRTYIVLWYILFYSGILSLDVVSRRWVYLIMFLSFFNDLLNSFVLTSASEILLREKLFYCQSNTYTTGLFWILHGVVYSIKNKNVPIPKTLPRSPMPILP